MPWPFKTGKIQKITEYACCQPEARNWMEIKEPKTWVEEIDAGFDAELLCVDISDLIVTAHMLAEIVAI